MGATVEEFFENDIRCLISCPPPGKPVVEMLGERINIGFQ